MPRTSMDERGRVLIPRELREKLGLSPGRPVYVEETRQGLVIRAGLSREEALRRLRGVITEEHGGERVDPRRVKDMWTERQPR